jgi:hypothetical protein
MPHLTKKQVEKTYKAEYFNIGDTWTDKRCKWNDYVEYLLSNDEISEKQAYNWNQPSFVNPPKPRLPKTCTLAYMLKNCGSQLNVEQALCGRFYHKTHNWVTIPLSLAENHYLLEIAADAIGGRNRTGVMRGLRRTAGHWALRRLLFRETDGKIVCRYCAGQDYPAELNELRKHLYSL